MKFGLKLPLALAAFAMITVTAMATAPTITGIPSQVAVGDAETSATEANLFVFPTDIDLEASVVDDDPITAITFSYKVSGNGNYRINGVEPIALGADGLAPSPALYQSGASNTNDDDDNDADPKTFTIRNIDWSPIAGPNVDPGAAGEIANSDAVITLIASDATTVGTKDFTVISVNDGNDATTGGGQIVYEADFTQGLFGWAVSGDTTVGSNASHGQDGAKGICVDVGPIADSDSDISYLSPLGIGDGVDKAAVQLAANKVYRVRASMSTNQITPGAQPQILLQWNAFANNWAGAVVFTDSVYSGNNLIAGSGDRTWYEVWITPAAVKSDAWLNGLAAGAAAEYPDGLAAGVDYAKHDITAAGINALDFQLRFRVYDSWAQGPNQGGEVCMSSIVVEAQDLDDMAVVSTPFEQATIANGEGQATGSAGSIAGVTAVESVGAAATDVAFTAGTMVVSPSGASFADSRVELRPGNEIAYVGTAANTDRYRVPWVADQLLLATFTLSAGSDIDNMGNCTEFLYLGMESAAVELAGVSLVSGNAPTIAAGNALPTTPNADGGFGYGICMPKFGAGDDFLFFFYSHSVTAFDSQGAGFDGAYFTPRLDAFSTASEPIGGYTTNVDPLTLHGWKVDVVEF